MQMVGDGCRRLRSAAPTVPLTSSEIPVYSKKKEPRNAAVRTSPYQRASAGNRHSRQCWNIPAEVSVSRPRDWMSLIDFSALRKSEGKLAIIDSALESPSAYQPVKHTQIYFLTSVA
eukprot:Gregarina_sp_Poly_1__1265@NODE_1307_length_4423_cov_31_474518_g89_i1_p4_GENE_NODE_1307_length_4423_cov_31_474518_g89_i1NODE_1307_length_4423_cov_31_474518_g89_i1_p4_ORF_typecomplete_len117_score13_07_NODE_1307_length_4423_cov_31_474518_g89_i168418